MYTIVMDKYKNLNTTVKTSIYQQESNVDTIQFLIPPTYNDMDLSEFTMVLKYVDPNGNFHSESLEVDEDLYKNYLRYTLPVTTKLTQVVGKVTLRITAIDFVTVDDTETAVTKLETNSTTLMVQKPEGFYDYVDFEDIEAYKAKVAQLNQEVTDMQEQMPNDLAIDENDVLQLTHDGTTIGEGVEVLVPGDNDLSDGDHDGVVDLNNV